MLQQGPETKSLRTKAPNPRFFVPDLSPQDRSTLQGMRPHFVFVAESPHINEIESDQLEQRRPLCGAAGRQWWNLLSEILEGVPDQDVSLGHLLKLCQKHQIAVLNAVQYPLDPKVTRIFPDADPIKNLGFCKAAGSHSYKKLRGTSSVQASVASLTARLQDPLLRNAEIHCLGNDAEWFVFQALSSKESFERVTEKIPHPSAWWRQGGLFGKIAREKLNIIFGK